MRLPPLPLSLTFLKQTLTSPLLENAQAKPNKMSPEHSSSCDSGNHQAKVCCTWTSLTGVLNKPEGSVVFFISVQEKGSHCIPFHVSPSALFLSHSLCFCICLISTYVFSSSLHFSF